MAPLTMEHWPAVERIYAAGIATGHATFESEPPTWEGFDAGKLAGRRWVALGTPLDTPLDMALGHGNRVSAEGNQEGAVLGWAAATAVSDRCVYAGVVEHSVYVDPAASGRGVGLRLLEALIESTETAGIWTMQSGVFPENQTSLAAP